ncbi:hypothetical protein OKA04_22255 [Luteolibacter flavescens]|uniref:DUF4153 domain-containing protein n=1 Tax=Luteolibacter flavescens TaxID=1859460 RepID=A0ABT3FV89_9BACT|nr:hypothetical protein [Luteolibacter flavescens]MCW1887475.1 hypothetical protein [Luteolibacter flavescens]
MRILDPLLFLTGHRGAIERIAATRHAWIVGAILVLSAGIARNYDHLDLLRNPEWFIGPFAASMVSIVFIFLWISGPLKLFKLGRGGPQFLAFLTFAWLTAPCAWIYGIPVESMTDMVTATKWNIAFLAIVSLWRVALMTRMVAVLTGVTHMRALPLILAPAALEMMVGSFFKSLSLIQIMGGVRLPPHTELLQQASQFTTIASFWVFVVVIIQSIYYRSRPAFSPLSRPPAPLPKSWIALASTALVLWAIAAVPFHPRIANRDRLTSLIDAKDYREAIEFASARTRADFPPHHYLPPEPDGYRFPFELLEALPADAPDWLRREWESSAIDALWFNLPYSSERWEDMERRLPKITALMRARADEIRQARPRNSDEMDFLRRFDSITKPQATKPSTPLSPEP